MMLTLPLPQCQQNCEILVVFEGHHGREGTVILRQENMGQGEGLSACCSSHIYQIWLETLVMVITM